MVSGLIYITGIGGSGKSTIRSELEKRGYEAHDVDDGFAGFFHVNTGKKSMSSTMAERTPEWRKQHRWIFMEKPLEKLQKRAQKKLIFLCGVTWDDMNYWDMFKKVFALVLDNETLKHRLKTRTTNDWGKLPHEFEETLYWNKTAKEDYKKLGAEIIDATKPVNQVVDEILKSLEPNKII